MEEFLDNIKVLINTLGYKVLEPIVQKNEITRQEYPKVIFKYWKCNSYSYDYI